MCLTDHQGATDAQNFGMPTHWQWQIQWIACIAVERHIKRIHSSIVHVTNLDMRLQSDSVWEKSTKDKDNIWLISHLVTTKEWMPTACHQHVLVAI